MRVKEAIIVEGRCDKAKLSGLVEGTIVETGGFGIFRDGEKMALIRRLAATVGVIIFTDSDGAGFVIRRRLSQCLPPGQVKHAYIPDIFGKERRKARPSKEGKLGVEGMDPALLRDCLLRAGATVDQGGQEARAPTLTKADLWDLGLSGGPESASLRQRVQKALGLPERLSANGLLQALNALYNREEALTQLKNHIPTDRS
ncbi:toprim domain-containing protein [Acutalibacter intestini]|uniref:toprim domain-containing protein n=1 Tax=Acutalibacter intestini TaxID=3093659 RepID=UPI002AC9CBF3|nr:DUF4093 domain-containing protein [Acutalibacter sp. M00204]